MSDIKLTQETPEQAARYALNIEQSNRRAGIQTSGDMHVYALLSAGYRLVEVEATDSE